MSIVRTFHFNKYKYGFDLLLDLHKFEENPALFFDPKPHMTDFFEILFFEEGEGVIEINGIEKKIKPQTVFFCCPYQKKRCDINSKNLKGFHLVFQNDFLSDFFNDTLFSYKLHYFFNTQKPQFLNLSNENYKGLQYILKEIIVEIQHYQTDSKHILRSLLYFLLCKLNRLYAIKHELPTHLEAHNTLYRFKKLVEQKIKSHRTVDSYATALNISRKYLNDIVKKNTGNSTKEIIDKRLLIEIKSALRYSEDSIAEIAEKLSFSEANNLTRFFKKHTSESPTNFRKRLQTDSY